MSAREAVVVSGALLVQHATIFATNIVVGRELGPGALGEFSLLRSIAATLLIVTPLGLDLALLKHAGLYRDRPAELRGLTFLMRVLVAGVNVGLILLLVIWLAPWLDRLYGTTRGFDQLVILAAVGVVFAADLQLSGALYRAAGRVPAYFIVTSYVQGTLRMALSVAVVWSGGGVAAILIVNATVAAGTVVLLELDRRRARAAGLKRSFARAGRAAAGILRESLWMCGSLLLYSAMRLLDLMMLGALATQPETGQYAAMSMVAQIIAIYPSAISQTLGPSIAVLHAADDRNGMQRELSAYLRQATLLGGYLLGGVAVFGVDLDLLFGAGFEFPVLLVVFLACGWYVSAVLAPLGYVLSMTGRHRQEVAVLVGGVALMAALLVVLIPMLGSIGAALAVAVSFVAVNAVRAGRVLRVLGGNPFRLWHVVPPLAFTALAAACRLGGGALAGRTFPALIAECALYSILALALFIAAFARAEERTALVKRFRL